MDGDSRTKFDTNISEVIISDLLKTEGRNSIRSNQSTL